METVHEFKAQRDQQRQPKEREGPEREAFAHLRGVSEDAVPGEAKSRHKDGQEDPAACRVDSLVEPWPARRALNRFRERRKSRCHG